MQCSGPPPRRSSAGPSHSARPARTPAAASTARRRSSGRGAPPPPRAQHAPADEEKHGDSRLIRLAGDAAPLLPGEDRQHEVGSPCQVPVGPVRDCDNPARAAVTLRHLHGLGGPPPGGDRDDEAAGPGRYRQPGRRVLDGRLDAGRAEDRAGGEGGIAGAAHADEEHAPLGHVTERRQRPVVGRVGIEQAR